MEQMNIKLTVITLFIIFLGCKEPKAQCKDDMGVFKCAEIFNEANISFLSDFTIYAKKRKKVEAENGQNWEIYLLKGTKYRFALCCYEGLEDIEMKLYDKEQIESKPYATTCQNGEDKAYFDFLCKKSEMYNVSIRFKDIKQINKKLCAIGLLGFIEKTK